MFHIYLLVLVRLSSTNLLRRKATLFLGQLLVVVLFVVQILRRAEEQSLLWVFLHANHCSCPFICMRVKKENPFKIRTEIVFHKLKSNRNIWDQLYENSLNRKITSKDGFSVPEKQHVAVGSGGIEKKTARLHFLYTNLSFYILNFVYVCNIFVSKTFRRVKRHKKLL